VSVVEDGEMLRRYVREQSEEAFAQLVDRYVKQRLRDHQSFPIVQEWMRSMQQRN
jgi:hypothetical protein